MDEESFWRSLEYRICSELSGLESDLRFLWCDGLIPHSYELDVPDPRILGDAWLLGGKREPFPILFPDEFPPPSSKHSRKTRSRGLPAPDTAEGKWSFTLLLKWRAKSRQDVRWQSLLPPPTVTRWLSVDFPSRCLRIDPAVAEPDRVV